MAKSNAPRIDVEISAITTNLTKGLAEARAELRKFNDDVTKGANPDFKNALQAEKLAAAELRTEAQRARTAIAQLALEKRKSAQATQAASGSYREAQQRLTALGRSIREAQGGFTSANPVIREQIREYNSLNNRLKEFDRQMGNNYRNVGNYTSALSGALPVLSQFTTIAGAVALATQGIRKSFETNLRLDALTYSLRQVSKDFGEFEKNSRFLESSSSRLGLEIVSTTEAFKQWQGAVKFSNLTSEQSRAIFSSVANAAAKMKLSTDDVKGTFLALSQMVSKGVVSMEELRRQLGDRLPGAFSLAAKAMGMSEMELNKLISTGQLMSEDFLPKFAQELDRAFGNDNVTKINSMQASVNRLSNEFTDLWQSDRATSFFTTVIDGFADVVKAGNNLINFKGFEDFFLRVSAVVTSPYGNLFGSKDVTKVADDLKKLQTAYSSSASVNFTKDLFASSSQYKYVEKSISDTTSELVKNKAYWQEQVDTIKESISAMDISSKGTKEWIDLTNRLNEAQKNLKLFSGKDAAPKTKGKTQSELIKEANEALQSGQIGALRGIDNVMGKIDEKWNKINEKINKIADVGLRKQQLELSKLGREQEKYNKFLDIYAKQSEKLTRGGLPTGLSGTISSPSSLPGLGRAQERIGMPRIAKGLTDEFTKQFQSTLRRGLASTFDSLFSDLTTLSESNYEIEKKYSDLRANATASQIAGLQKMEALEKKINNGLTNMLSKIGSTFTGIAGNLLSSALSTGISSGSFKDLKNMFTGDSKAIGYGALGSLAGGALSGVLKPSDIVGQGLSGALAGAGSGVAIGTMIGGPLGTILGGVGGAIIGGISSIFGSSKRKREEELLRLQLAEQKKIAVATERQNMLTYASQVIGQMTNQGVVTSVERDALGGLVANIKGSDIQLVLDRYNNSRN